MTKFKIIKISTLIFPLAIFIGLGIWLLPDERGIYPAPFSSLLGQALPERTTPELLTERYTRGGLSILLVPGHDNEYPGAEFGATREADVNLALAHRLQQFLATDGHFRVFNTRSFPRGEYLPVFANYFVDERPAIDSFRLRVRQEFLALIASGAVEERSVVDHNFALPEVASRLYGINKWANERAVDLTLHIHFNDYPGRRYHSPGRYTGLAIYIPERQYPHARASRALGESLFSHLTKSVPPSNLPAERDGVVEDQELIAIGAHGSRDGAAVLVEYGYIYESPLRSPAVREAYLDELAWQTYLAIKRHFEPEFAAAPTRLLPHRFAESLGEGMVGRPEVLALQKALALEGVYPPPGRDLSACPINGNFGPCVHEATTLFQTRYQIPATGFAGPLTLEKLATLYGG